MVPRPLTTKLTKPRITYTEVKDMGVYRYPFSFLVSPPRFSCSFYPVPVHDELILGIASYQ